MSDWVGKAKTKRKNNLCGCLIVYNMYNFYKINIFLNWSSIMKFNNKEIKCIHVESIIAVPGVIQSSLAVSPLVNPIALCWMNVKQQT